MSLSRTLRSMMNQKTLLDRLIDKLEDYTFYNKLSDCYYNIKAFKNNLGLFLRLAWGWRPWDYKYTIDVLVTLLKEQAHNTKIHGHHVGAEKTYRRCMAAAGLIDKAYNSDMDKSQANLLELMYDRTHIFTRSAKYSANREFYSKLYDVARKRSDEAEKVRKQEAWEYLNKYIEHFWD